MIGRCILGLVLFAALTAWSRANAEPELHVRQGLPNLVRHLETGGDFRVAYLGGSITAAADGWRSLTTEHLKKTYPKLNIVEITAGLPGTGSNLGACRVGFDVLRHHPDLLFVEFAVNDTGAPVDRIERTMEGIVRQARRENPMMDIWFVYTVSLPVLPELEAGRFQPSAQAMERVATHYGIPSLHFGVDVAQQVQAHRLIFKGPAPAGSETPIFSADGVHPTSAGHRVYFAAIERSLPALLGASRATKITALPTPLRSDNWEFATIKLMDNVDRKGAWSLVPLDDANLRGTTKALLPPTWRTDSAGSAVEFEFHGRQFGLLGIGTPDSGQFRVTVDDLPPVTDTFFDSYASPTFCRQREWFYPAPLSDGRHRVRVEFVGPVADKIGIKAKAGRPAASDTTPYELNRLTLCGALVIGSVAP